MTDVLRLLGGLALLALASLTALPTPHYMLWTASIAATEWGYWLAFAALLPLIPTRAPRRLGRLGALCSLCAIILFVLPVARATQLNTDLPAAFNSRFGSERRERTEFADAARTEPLVFSELLKPATSAAVRFEERVFGAFDGQNLTLDIYRPGYVHGPIPAVIVVHGGTWQDGDNSEFVAVNAYLAARDYVVAAINYRLAPRWRFPAARDDVLSALAYLKVHAEQLGVDPHRIALLGRSAGGQLALLAAYTAQDASVRGVISLYGPSDLRYAYEHPAPPALRDTRSVLETYLGGAPDATEEDTYFAASPINFVSASSPPTLLIHGLRDAIVSPAETARLVSRLEEARVKHLFIRLPWATHGCDKSFGGPCGQIATYAIERFLDGVMTSPPTAPAKPRGRERRSASR
jgi:acetyl esterase/lipase